MHLFSIQRFLLSASTRPCVLVTTLKYLIAPNSVAALQIDSSILYDTSGYLTHFFCPEYSYSLMQILIALMGMAHEYDDNFEPIKVTRD